VIAFDLDWAHSEDALRAALNANLPPDAAIYATQTAPPEFHPRYDALSRCYRYRIFCQAVRDPLKERYAWRVWPAVDLLRLQTAAGYFQGSFDFAAFGTPPRAGGTTTRNVFQAGWQEQGENLIFEIVANAFLYHMVRRIVHFLVAIGQGRLEPAAVHQHLDGSPQELVQGLAPPQGLTLVKVSY
jgi:tRNA pseudouridine38-40 synthase